MKKREKVIFILFMFIFVFTMGKVSYAAETKFDIKALKVGDKIFFDNSYSNWDNVKLYIFNKDKGTGLFDWNDSLEMTKEGNSNIYSLEITQDIEDRYGINSKNMDHIIFRNNNGNSQSIDLAYFDSRYSYVFDRTESGKLKGYWYVIDTSELDNLCDEAEAIEKKYYTEESYSVLSGKLNDAKDILEDKIRVENAENGGYTTVYFNYVNDLRTAIDSLVPNKQLIKNKIDEVLAGDYTGYTEESVNSLNNAIDNAENVYNSDDVTVQDIKDQITALDEAVNNLVVDKTRLADVISLVDDFIADYGKYINPEEIEVLKEVLNNGKNVLANENVTVENVSDAVDNITNVATNLHFNKELLEELIKNAKEYNLNEYTDNTSAVLKEAISDAEKLLTQNEITPEEFVKIEEKVNSAIKQLVKKQEGIGSDEKIDSSNPLTGSTIVYIVGLMIISAGVFTASCIYKKNNN